MDIKQFVAVRAFIVHDGKVLVIRESKKYEGGSRIGQYDFPGGKVKPGEHFEDALKREALEECGLAIEVGEPFFAIDWWPNVPDKNVQILGTFFICHTTSDAVKVGPDFDDYKWIDPAAYADHGLIAENQDACKAYVGRAIS